MSSPRRYGSPGASSRSRREASPTRVPSHHIPRSHRMPISDEAEVPGHGRISDEAEVRGHGRSKRPYYANHSYPTWVMLKRVGGRRDGFPGDGTTSRICYTSGGEQISVSFDLQMPPLPSVLTLDWPQGPSPSQGTNSYPRVIAAHSNVVLLEIISPARYPRPAAIDYFVYKASEYEPSLTMLPVCYRKGPRNADSPRPRIMSRVSMGIVCCSKDAFIISDLEGTLCPSAVNIYLFGSGSDNWKFFRDVQIQRTEGVSDLGWWSTDIVLPYLNHYLIWVDYLRGVIIGSMSNPEKPVLQYLSLPVDPVEGNPYDSHYGRGCPEASRSLCDTHHGLRFVNVNQCGSSFIITLWSLSDSQTWIKEETLDAVQLHNLDPNNRLPNVQPKFPVVDMENPDTVCFLLSETSNLDAPTWMIKINMKKRILLDFTRMSAKMMFGHLSFISSAMPCYLSRQITRRG